MTRTEVLLVAVRAIHLGSSVVLFGEIFFATLTGWQRNPEGGAPAPEQSQAARNSRLRRVAPWTWLVVVVSGVCWLALISAQMTRAGLVAAIDPATLLRVLEATTFGQSWSLRMGLALALLVLWQLLRKPLPQRNGALGAAVALSGGLLAGVAWAGHANAEDGLDGLAHHASDALHLLAAGVWLGGLAPLADILGRLGDAPTNPALDRCTDVAARFGNWAALSVAALLLSGVVNAYYLLHVPQALLATTYGNLLLAKLLVFALMLIIAAANRTRLTAALLRHKGDAVARADAARRLRRNVRMEQALGAGVLVLVAALGITAPSIAA